MKTAAVRPRRVTVRWTEAGRTALLLGLCGVAATAPFGSRLALLPALLVLAFVATAPIAWLSLRALRVRAPTARTVRSGSPFEFPLEFEQAGAPLAACDVIVFAGANGPASARALGWLERLQRRSQAVIPCQWRTRRRGVLRRLELRLVSSFPLGWWRAQAHVELEVEWLSLPSSARLVFEHASHARRRRERGLAASTRRGDDEFYALREARPGDSPHWIHWRSTARRGRTVVRELRGEERPEQRVVLLGWVDRALSAHGSTESFEHAVSLTAALVERNARNGEATRVRFEGPTTWSLRVPPSRAAVQTLLARLAVVECAPLIKGHNEASNALRRAADEGAHVVHALAKLSGSWRVLQRAGRSSASVVVARVGRTSSGKSS